MANISSMILERLNGKAPSLSPAASLYAKKEDEEKKNKGGLLGGIGYLAHKLGLGFLQGIEGVWDYAAGGIADLFGGDDWAKDQFESDWFNYNAADDWYDPGEGWKFAGDVAGGMGTSLPGMLTAAGLTIATGGTAAPAALGLAVGSLSAAGTSTKEAMQQSGELTGKEYLYGAGMGAVEAVTEKLSGGLGTGITKAAKSVGKAFGKVAAKETAEAAVKSAAKKGVALSLKTAAKQAGKEFASEAFEEGFSEWIAPYIARATYNPNAQNATAEEIFYSALVGGLSGVGMAGISGSIAQVKNVSSGNQIVNEGRARQIIDLAKRYMEEGFSNTEDAQGIRELYAKLASDVESGAALSTEQKRKLGELNAFEMAEQLRPTLQRSALTAVQSADAIAERLNADGRYKMVNDKFVYVDSEQSIPEGATVREITAEDITKGYDPSKKGGIKEAIQKNDVIRYIAASDAAGRFIMTAKDFEKAALSGQKIQSQADLNLFIENASAEQKAAVGKELGVTDWNTLNIEGFNERAAAYRESGKAEAYKQKTAKIEKMKQLADSKPKSIPRAIALADGDVKHYADADSDFAIARSGDTFTVYDYTTGNVTRELTRAEVNAELARYRESKSATSETTNATSEKTSENLSSDAEIEIKDEKISKTDLGNEFSSASENYKKRLSSWDGKTEGFSFVLGDTSSVLADVEVNGKKIGNKQIRLDATKAKRILKDHPEMDIDVLKSLPEITEDPIFVLESKTQSGRIVLFGDITAKNGKPVMVALELNPTTRSGNTYLDIIKIASAYTRTNTQNLIDTSNIKYVDKKRDRVSNWLKVNRLQLPLPSQQNASVTNSIPDSAGKVNTSDEKNTKKAFENEFSEEKAAPTVKQIKEAAEARRQDAEIEALAKEKIKDYKDLSKPNQSMIRKVLREARAKGLSDADALSYARVAARSGLDIVFDKKACYKGKNEAGEDVYHAGYYDPENNRIVVNPETNKKHASLLIHELSHAIRSYRTKSGETKYFIDENAKISEAMWKKIKKYYADENGKLDAALAFDEASAYYAEQMLGTDAAIDLLLGEKPTLKQKILSFFTKSAAYYSTDEKLSKEARRHFRKFKAMFDAFTARNYGRNAETGLAGDKSARRYSFAGTNAETADRMKLSTAEKMLAEGVDSETVRKETGWFKGYDGKWRFEIDDLDSSLIEKPNLTKHVDDGEVYFTGKLSDILDHKALLAAYPKLKDINIVIQKTEFGVDAIYQPKSNYITLSIEQFKRRTKAYLDYLNGGRKAEIEKIEATTEYKEYNRLYDDEVTDSMEPEAWLKAEAEARDKFFSSELGKRYYQLMWGKNGFAGETFELGWGDAAKEVLIHELQHAIQNEEGFATGTNTRDANYDRNAGEIEARDAAKRANLTKEQRKNTRPDIDRMDVVFKEGGSVSYYAKGEYDSETSVIKDQIKNSQKQLNSMDVAFVGQSPKAFATKTVAKVWAVNEMKKYGFQADVKGVGTVEFGKNDIYGAIEHLTSPEEIAAIIAVPRVLKRGILIGEHGNHKYRGKHTVTYAAPIELNGVRGNMAVVVNMRNKKYYVHRVILPDGSAFKFDIIKKNAEQEMYQGVPNGSLANTTSSASTNSIPDQTEKSNPSDENSSKKSSESGKRASMDADYMSAVERGDMVTAQRMVDEAAKAAEYTIKAYHGTNADFTVFDLTKSGTNFGKVSEGLFFFTDKKQAYPNSAKDYARYAVQTKGGEEKIYEVYLKIQKPLIVDSQRSYDPVSHFDLNAEKIYDRYFEGDYDGIIVKDSTGKKSESTLYILDNAQQIKSADPVTYDDDGKVIPLSDRFNPKKSDIRFSMEEIDPAKMGEPTLPRTAGTMSVGQYKKRIADLTKAKSYSKDQIYDIVKKLPMADMAMEKTREQVAEAVWQIYNEQLTASERREAAHDIAQFLTARLMSEAKTENPDATEANEAMAYLRTGIGRLAFSEADRSEILHNLDKEGWRRILGRWGFKGKRNADGTLQGARTPMEVFVTDIAREMPGMEHLEQMHPVEAFLEIDSYYSRVKEEAAKKKTSAFLYMSDEDINSLAKSIEDIIVEAYNQGGGKSIFIKRIEQGISYYEQRAAKYKEEFNEIRGRDKIHGLLMDQTQKMRDLKLRRFANITDGANETFKNIIKTLSSLQYRGNLSVTNAKKAVKDLYVWYTSKEVKENLFGFTDEDPGTWQQGVAEMLEELANDENKGFSKVDLYALLDVLSYFTHFVENFGKVWHHGVWVDAKELATNFIQVSQNQSKVKHRFVRDLLRKYMQLFGDPAAVVRLMDQYQDGFFTQIYDDLRDAAISASYAERDILAAYDAFLKDHKRYVETASKETVQYRGVDIPKMHLIGLYMTMKRKHAHAGYAINGFSFKDAKGDTVRVRGSLDPNAVYTKQEIEDYIAREQKKIENLLSDTDKQYISILEKVYNEDAKRLKSDRDIQRFGMTNATNDYYYPIRRANAAQKLDADMQMEIDRVSSASFNKDTVAGAKQELFIESADSLFLRHVHVVCQYAYLTPVLDMQKMLYNLDISGNKNHPISIHTESQNIWPDGFKYFRDLVSDVQGIPRTSSAGMKFLSSIRGNYAKFQLGANPKTWLTQLSSLLASTSLLDASSVVKGFGMKSDGFTEYSKLAKLRAEDNAAAKAQGVLDNKIKRTTNSIGDALMAPIGMMDKFVVGRLFAACQVQIEKDGGAKIGSEENKIEAGKLLTRVILETQQNSLATERSAAMRSGNEFYRALTMFRSDSMKVIGRVIDGFGEVSAIRGILKNKTMDEDTRKSLESRLKKSKKKTAKASVSLILSSVFMALIAQGFRWLYAKDKEEDETFAKTMLADSLGNMIGGLPGFADAYTKIVDGYDVGNYSYSAINDVLDSAKGLFDIAGGIMTGEGTAQERMRGIRNASYSLGQLLGLPTRNVYNVLYGLTKRVSPGTGYKIDNAFYEKNFKTDLEKAIEKGDDKMAMLTLQLLLGERMGEDIDKAVFDELLSLSKKGMKVLPRVTPESITVNGETYEFTEDEKAAVADIYEQRNDGLGSLFASSAYKAMTDADKEKAVSVLYDLYYDKALSEALGVDRGNALLFANAIGYGKYAAFKTRISGITSDKDKDGNTVQGSKRAKVVKAIVAMDLSREEKLLLIASLGYRLQDGDIRGISAVNAKRMLLKYILSMKGTQAEKAALAEACGFEVKNGKILKNSL